MKKFIIYIAILLLIQGINITSLNYEELHSLMIMKEEMKLNLDSWELIAIDKHSTKKYMKIVEWLESNAEKMIEENGNSFNLVEDGYIKVTINLIDGSKKVQVVMTASEWNESVQAELERKWIQLQSELFTKSTNLYTCVKLNNNGIMIDGIYAEEIQKLLEINSIYNQKDNIEHTDYEGEYYGYTSKWNTGINMNNEKINFQMAVKSHLQNEKEIIIGTPAILNEY